MKNLKINDNHYFVSNHFKTIKDWFEGFLEWIACKNKFIFNLNSSK